jgi:hypothetical protein
MCSVRALLVAQRKIRHGDVPRCVRACTTPADCDQGFATSDADNHACENNVCVYLGCNSGDECAAVLVDYPVCR